MGLGFPKTEWVLISTPDGIYEISGHGVPDAVQIIGVNRLLSDQQVEAIKNSGFTLIENRYIPCFVTAGDPPAPICPPAFRSYIFHARHA